ncbi:MAG TPA: hypothetical protein VGL07_17815 [Buttiauxella sp.]|jgi:hypothetical protein
MISSLEERKKGVNLLSDGATFRMHARQLILSRNDMDIDSMRETLGDIFAGSDISPQYVELFRMVCDLEFVEAAGSAMVDCYYSGRE